MTMVGASVGPRPDHAVFEPQRGKIEKAFVGKRHGGRFPEPRRDDAQKLGKALLDGFAGGVDFGFGAGIVGAPRFQDRDQVGHAPGGSAPWGENRPAP